MEKISAGARQETGAETGERAVVGSFLFGRVSLIQQAVIQFLLFVAQQSDRIIIRNQAFPI